MISQVVRTLLAFRGPPDDMPRNNVAGSHGGVREGAGRKRTKPGQACWCTKCKGTRTLCRSQRALHRTTYGTYVPDDPAPGDLAHDPGNDDPDENMNGEDMDTDREDEGHEPINDHPDEHMHGEDEEPEGDDHGDEVEEHNAALELIACEVCNDRGGYILICDHCGKGWHLYCVVPCLYRIPEGAWYCANCAATFNQPLGAPDVPPKPPDWVDMSEEEVQAQDDALAERLREMRKAIDLPPRSDGDAHHNDEFLLEQQLEIMRLYTRGRMTQETLASVMEVVSSILTHFGARRAAEEEADEPKDWQTFAWRYRSFLDKATHQRICDCGEYIFPPMAGNSRTYDPPLSCPLCHKSTSAMTKEWVWQELSIPDAIRALYLDMNMASMMRAHDLYFSERPDDPPGPDDDTNWVVHASWESKNYRERRKELPAFFAEPRNVSIVACADGASTTHTEKRRCARPSFKLSLSPCKNASCIFRESE